MRRPAKLRTTLLTPLIYTAALLLLIEEWLWNVGLRMISAITAWPPLHALEVRIARLPPYWALCAFALPAILLFPVKILALIAIANGHPWSGVGVILGAKLGGAALVARLFTLTRPTLLTLPWFARWHDKFMSFKDRWVGRLKETRAFRRVSMLAALMRSASRALLTRFRSPHPIGSRHANRPIRILRRLLAMWRARRR
jgi:hypothetical protein